MRNNRFGATYFKVVAPDSNDCLICLGCPSPDMFSYDFSDLEIVEPIDLHSISIYEIDEKMQEISKNVFTKAVVAYVKALLNVQVNRIDIAGEEEDCDWYE